ncbi:MAG: two-component system LytT family response regulator [Alteromonadaceae bacterium]|jgi:two-component system LytT family response regulator
MFKTLLVDDERLARVELKRLLKVHETVEIVAEATNAIEALEILTEQSIDLVFLDINMPGLSGLELAAQIDSAVQFIFCTAHADKALDAFNLNAIDYLLKPIEPQRLLQAIGKLAEVSVDYLAEQHGLLLKFGDIQRIVRLSEVQRMESVGNMIALYTPYGKSFLNTALSSLARRLDPNQFFKANRAEIIRIDQIIHLEPGIKTGTFVARMQSGAQVEMSRRQSQQLKIVFQAGLLR